MCNFLQSALEADHFVLRTDCKESAGITMKMTRNPDINKNCPTPQLNTDIDRTRLHVGRYEYMGISTWNGYFKNDVGKAKS